MAEIKDSQLIRDALGSPVPQYWDEASQMYIARTVDGSFADVDFSKVRLIRDKLGSPIPQLWDTETARFVPGKGGGNGEVTIESVPGLRSELDQTNATLAEKAKQNTALSLFYKKLNNREPVTIVCQGDSITYGTDTVSADRRTDAVLTMDSGQTIVTPKAGKTYPEALNEYLTQVYKSTVTVINKGIPGAYAKQSFDEVTINRNADVVLLKLGTNDATASGDVPAEIAGNISRYMEDMSKIIKRYLSWGTAVILLTPTKSVSASSSGLLASYRNALHSLGKEFNCPVIDTELFMNGTDSTYYSDGIHLNTKGYTYFASRLASAFIGYGEFNAVEINSGTVLSFRGKRDGMVNNGALFQQAAASVALQEGTVGQGYYLEISNDDSVFMGFKAVEDNMILIPVYRNNYLDGQEKIKISLDFGNEQGSYPLLTANGLNVPHTKPTSVITQANYSGIQDIFNGSLTLASTTKYLAITNKGWHNVKIEAMGAAATMFYGFVVMRYQDFKNLETLFLVKNPPVVDFTPVIQGSTAAGTHTYTSRSGKYFIDLLRKTVKYTVVIEATIDNTIDGIVIIPNLPKSALISTAGNAARASGFFATGERVYPEISSANNFIKLFKQTSSGTTTTLLGTEIRGKTINISIDIEYMYQ